MSDLKLDVDQASELKAAFRRSDWTNPEIKKICEGSILADFHKVVKGLAEIKMIEHLINLDADPFVPDGWTVKEHIKAGQWKFNPNEVEFYLSKEQKKGESIEGNKLHKELADKPVFNANVLDYLLAHPELIPDEWKKDKNGNTRYIFFWGTIYRSSGGRLYVRYLRWDGVEWDWGDHWLVRGFDGIDPAAVRAS